MARPTTTDSKRTVRTVTVTFTTLAEMEAAKAHAKSKGLGLATLLKFLLAADMKAA